MLVMAISVSFAEAASPVFLFRSTLPGFALNVDSGN
jgi:hypothetical protein